MKNTQFTDNRGTTWDFTIDALAMERVRVATGWDMGAELRGEPTPQPLGQNPMVLFSVMYALCLPQAQANGISEDEYRHRLWGIKHFVPAWRALLHAAADLFPAPLRSVLHQLTPELTK